MEEKDYLAALVQFGGLGPSRLTRLRSFFNGYEATWQASFNELIQTGLKPERAGRWLDFKKKTSVEEIKERLRLLGIKTVCLDEAAYPPLLRHIHAPPPLLYYRGSRTALGQPGLAVVGSRTAGHYGRRVVEGIVTDLARAGVMITSGLALGIDGAAHAAALDAGGTTTAVMGAGLDIIYPHAHRGLAEKIQAAGCLVSEFPPDTPPYKTNFPRRNRIIAGLSMGTLVISAAKKSGALSTAHHALAENREVMAVPGSIFDPLSAGTNQLIKLGARPITEASDVCIALKIEPPAHALLPNETIGSGIEPGEETLIMDHLSHEPTHINHLVRLTRLDIHAINSRLTIMEIKGLVKNTGNMNYIRL